MHQDLCMVSSPCCTDTRMESYICRGLSGEGKLKVARYHSLSAKKETIPEELSVIAVSDDDGEIMAVKHKR